MTSERRHLFTITPAPGGTPFDVFVPVMRALADILPGCTVGNFEGGYAVYGDDDAVAAITRRLNEDDEDEDG